MIISAIVDTCVFSKNQFDFLGMETSDLKAFYSIAKKQHVKLLNHPILSEEVKTHIRDSRLVEKPEELMKNLNRNKTIWRRAGVDVESTLNNLAAMDLETRILEEYSRIYNNAIELDYTNPRDVFKDYFEVKPPFSHKDNKKHEFPDAFVINAIKQYLEKNPNESILVISEDRDWEKALIDHERILFARTIDEAIIIIQSSESIEPILKRAESNLKGCIEKEAEFENYTIHEYELIDDVEISNIRVRQILDGIIPLIIDERRIVLKCSAELVIQGCAETIDFNNSVYDTVDHEYVFMAINDVTFKDAVAIVDCEVDITFNPNDIHENCLINDVKIVSPLDISLKLGDDNSWGDTQYLHNMSKDAYNDC